MTLIEEKVLNFFKNIILREARSTAGALFVYIATIHTRLKFIFFIHI